VAHVLTEAGPVRASFGGPVLCRMARSWEATPGVGDWCLLRGWPGHRHTIESLLPRRTSLTRATTGAEPGGEVLFANADHVAVVLALQPLPETARVERLVGAARRSGAQPLLVLTKADLVADPRQVLDAMTATAPGLEVLCTSAVTGEGVDRLRALAAEGRTLALLGHGGHGRSSLLEALVGTPVLTARAGDRRGGRRTRPELVALPTGGAVIDTPALSDLAQAEPTADRTVGLRD